MLVGTCLYIWFIFLFHTFFHMHSIFIESSGIDSTIWISLRCFCLDGKGPSRIEMCKSTHSLHEKWFQFCSDDWMKIRAFKMYHGFVLEKKLNGDFRQTPVGDTVHEHAQAQNHDAEVCPLYQTTRLKAPGKATEKSSQGYDPRPWRDETASAIIDCGLEGGWLLICASARKGPMSLSQMDVRFISCDRDLFNQWKQSTRISGQIVSGVFSPKREKCQIRSSMPLFTLVRYLMVLRWRYPFWALLEGFHRYEWGKSPTWRESITI